MKKIVTFFGMLLTMLFDLSDRCMGCRQQETTSSGAGMALHSVCRTSALYCSDAADQSRMVGSTSATCGTYVDPSDDNSFCCCLWCRDGNGNSSRMHRK